ncbi:MAG: T9SS type A sorting domain-containing protein [Ignavibacteriaceae bacterium]|nr:T9SS type A sorting domain-containing protein [Ignavibacteriaceae bacterium]
MSDFVPVELTSFSAVVNDDNVELCWITSTETNNQGFEIQRSKDGKFETIGFVDGHGTTTETQVYSFIDKNLITGKYNYRLKQIDFDGTFEYSNVIEVEVTSPSTFSLEQNYPNPFNPNTKIRYTIPNVIASETKQTQFVSLKIYDVLGNEVATLLNEHTPSGSYEVEFGASNLPSGTYFYQLRAGSFIETKKMIVLK